MPITLDSKNAHSIFQDINLLKNLSLIPPLASFPPWQMAPESRASGAFRLKKLHEKLKRWERSQKQ